MRLMKILIILAVAALAHARENPPVVNGETPLEGESRVELAELWRVGGDDPDLLIGSISHVLFDAQDRVYALDGQLSEIQIFDGDGSHLDTIGRNGEGPGEWVNGSSMFWTPRGELAVLQAWPGKIVLIQPDGTPGPRYALPFQEGGGFQIISAGFRVGDHVVVSGSAWVTREGEQKRVAYIKGYDMDGAEIVHYHQQSKTEVFGNQAFTEAGFRDFQSRWAAADDGRVAAALSFDDYAIQVWNADGTPAFVIERPAYTCLERDDAEIEVFQTVYEGMTRWNPGSTFAVSDHHAAIEQLQFREDGSLWVQSGHDRWAPRDDVFTSFDVYDRAGRYVRRVHLVGEDDPVEDGLYLGRDRVFVVTDQLAALLMSMGIDGVSDGEIEPVSVIAYSAALDAAAGD